MQYELLKFYCFIWEKFKKQFEYCINKYKVYKTAYSYLKGN